MPIHVRVTVHHDRIAAAMRDPGGVPATFVRGRSAMAAGYAKMACPVETGRLRSSIAYRVEVRPHAMVGIIYSPLPHARHQHEGTGIYGPRRQWIYPRTGRWLVFEVKTPFGPLGRGGKYPARGRRPLVFARRVRGVPPSPFLVHGLQLALPGVPISRH